MTVVKSIIIAFAMFSRLPVPKVEWDARNMRYAMAAFPLIGVAVGVVVVGWHWLAVILGFGPFLRGAGFALLPALVTGGIHLDGFSDTVDALASHGDREKRHAILKDPHLGAFAAITAAGYLLLFAAFASEVGGGSVWCFALLFVLSRALAGLTLVYFTPARPDGLGRLFHDAAAKQVSGAALAAFALAAAVFLVLWGGWSGVAALAAALLCLVFYRRMAIGVFGGVTGDLAGWFLQVCELATLAALVVAQKSAAIV